MKAPGKIDDSNDIRQILNLASISRRVKVMTSRGIGSWADHMLLQYHNRRDIKVFTRAEDDVAHR